MIHSHKDSHAIERRITLRLMSYWEKLRKGRAMPAERDINPDDLHDLWDSCFLMLVKDAKKAEFRCTYLGHALRLAQPHGMVDGDAQGLLSPECNKFKASYGKIIDSRKPLIEEGEFENKNRQMVKYRQCLLPFGDAKDVSVILGGVHFKIFPPKAG